jgi:hypothetical protein
MRVWVFSAVLLAGCFGATETNVTPAPCDEDSDCEASQRCEPLEDYDASAGPAPRFCRER